jgi:hypothetical protein
MPLEVVRLEEKHLKDAAVLVSLRYQAKAISPQRRRGHGEKSGDALKFLSR